MKKPKRHRYSKVLCRKSDGEPLYVVLNYEDGSERVFTLTELGAKKPIVKKRRGGK